MKLNITICKEIGIIKSQAIELMSIRDIINNAEVNAIWLINEITVIYNSILSLKKIIEVISLKQKNYLLNLQYI